MLTATGLGPFIEAHRDELIRRCQAKVAQRSSPPPTACEIDHGVPLFLEQMVGQLKHDSPNTIAIRATAIQHGRDLFLEGLTVEQVVHDYGDVRQSVTENSRRIDVPREHGGLSHAEIDALTTPSPAR
jgi:hypothetical protein